MEHGWIAYPRERFTLPGPKVTGSVELTWQRDGIVFVHTAGAHVNDDNEAVTFRDERYLVTMHFYRQSDGTWGTGEHVHIVRGTGGDAPPSYRAAIVEALSALVAEHTTYERRRAGEYADARQDGSRYARDVAEAQEVLEAAQAKLRECERRIRAVEED